MRSSAINDIDDDEKIYSDERHTANVEGDPDAGEGRIPVMSGWQLIALSFQTLGALNDIRSSSFFLLPLAYSVRSH